VTMESPAAEVAAAAETVPRARLPAGLCSPEPSLTSARAAPWLGRVPSLGIIR
jgi:hypothetical protein